MWDEYDCIDPEWDDECRDCGRTFTNQGLHGIECPHCEEENDEEEEEEEDHTPNANRAVIKPFTKEEFLNAPSDKLRAKEI